MMENIKISNFLDTSYKEYALYVIKQRAIPSVIDGLKITPRKILYVSSKIWKNYDNEEKVETLAGRVLSDAKYHHGSASLEDAIVSMAQQFKNNLPMLNDDGQYGSVKSPNPSAARYIETKLKPIFWDVFKDGDLLSYNEEDGKVIEPNYFLPIIPMILINGQSGIAIGHASDIMNRNAKDVIKACILYLNGKKIINISPQINGFDGDFVNDITNNKKWYIYGRYDQLNTTTIKVTEVPPSMTYEKYEEYLDGLVFDKKIISYENIGKGIIDYRVKMNRYDLSKMEDIDIKKLLGLIEMKTENFTCLDENNNLKIFDKTEDIISYFVDFRLKWYQVRKDKQIKETEDDISKLRSRGKFIKAIIDGEVIINKRSKEDIISQIETLKLIKIDDSYDYLLNMPIYSLTKEKWEALISDGKSKIAKLDEIKKSDPKQTYIDELNYLLKVIK